MCDTWCDVQALSCNLGIENTWRTSKETNGIVQQSQWWWVILVTIATSSSPFSRREGQSLLPSPIQCCSMVRILTNQHKIIIPISLRRRWVPSLLIRSLMWVWLEGVARAYSDVAPLLMVCQIAAFLEVVHSALGFVKGDIVSSLMQVRIVWMSTSCYFN